MVVLRLGKLNNEERKFIPTKENFLEEYKPYLSLYSPLNHDKKLF